MIDRSPLNRMKESFTRQLAGIFTTSHQLSEVELHMDDSWLACLMMKELSKQFELMTLGSESLGMKLMAEVVKAKILQDVKFGSATMHLCRNRDQWLEAESVLANINVANNSGTAVVAKSAVNLDADIRDTSSKITMSKTWSKVL